MTFKKLLVISTTAFLILLSLFPRSIEVLNGNPIFDIDQGRDYMAVKSIVVDHKLTLIGAELGAGQAGLSYLFHGPGYFYMLTIPFIIFNGNPVGGVWLMLFFGLSAIAFGYYLVSKSWGQKAGFLMAYLLAACPFLIGQSRFIENHFASAFFILLVFYSVYQFTKSKTKGSFKFVFLAALLSAFMYNLETAIAIPLCITLFVYCLILFRKKVISYLPYLVAGYAISFSPMFLFESRHGFMGFRNLFGYLLMSHKVDTNSISTLTHAQHIINLIVFSFSDSFTGRLLLPVNIMFIGFILLTGFVFIKENNRINKNFLSYLLFLFPVNFLVFILLRNIVFQHYIIDLILAYLLLFTYELTWLYRNKYSKLATVLSLYLMVLLVVATFNAFNVSVHDFSDYGGEHKLKGKMDAVDFIYKDAQGKPFGLLIFSPPVYTYPYDYLVWWYGQKKYGYTPYQEKKGTFYLLIEKDPTKPWSYKGWEETIIKTGSVISTKTLPSGLIVEKRISE